MIRRTALAAMAGLIGLAMVASTSHATTSVTRTCIKNARKVLTSCRLGCTDQFKTRQAQCFGPGFDCATKCQSGDPSKNLEGADKCLADVAALLRACQTNDDRGTQDPSDDIPGCAVLLQQGLDQCRELGDRDPTFDVDACGNQKRLANLQCQLDCRAKFDDIQQNCNVTFTQCLAACASCATPAECPQ